MNCECALCKNNKEFDMPKELLEEAIKGNVVLFCGAGISTENRILLPITLYDSIQEELEPQGETESFCELMQRYCSQPNGRRKLLKSIKKRFDYIESFPELSRMSTRFHRELAEIFQIRTIITTNWDTYFEDYCGAIPLISDEDYTFYGDDSRFVLKLHGSINNWGSIVATTDDYKKCFKRLQKNTLGGTFREILATKSVVFIGFSFGDDDLNQIIKYLRTKMGDVYPHVYVVSLDENIKEKIKYKHCTVINTDGTFFIHRLKKELLDRGALENCDIYEDVKNALGVVLECHSLTSEIDVIEYPLAVFSMAYQDGVIHALERYMKRYVTGEYNEQGYLKQMVKLYEKTVQECRRNGDYFDEIYYIGYQYGLMLIGALSEDKNALDLFPFMYLPESENLEIKGKEYLEALTIWEKTEDEYVNCAREIASNLSEGLEIHHPPV